MNGLAIQAYGLLIGIALAAAGIPVGPDSLTARAVVSSGHRGAVLDMAEDGARGLLFSVGEDGFLRVWDSGAGSLLRRIAVTRRKAQSVALDPAAPIAAVVVTDGVRSYAVDVWNWDTGKRLYSIPLESAPLFVRFSRSGTFLLFGDMQWDSLHICRSGDGTTVPFHPEGFGMVGFAETSRTDATLMTYQAAGMISYWDIATGTSIKEVPTVGGMVNIRTSDDRGCLVGQSGTQLIGIDAVSGETRFSMSTGGIASLDISGDAAEIACLSADGSLQVRSPGSSPSVSPIADGFDWRPRLVRMTPHGVLVGGDDGQIGMISQDGHLAEFVRDVLARVTGIAAQGHTLAVAAGDVIHVFALGVKAPGMSPVTEAFSTANPYPGPVGLEFLDGQLVVWQQGANPGALGSIDLATRKFSAWNIPFVGPLAAVTARKDTLFTLEKDGTVKVLKFRTGEELFQTRWPGAVCIAPFGSSSLVLGRLSGGVLGSSLVRIDMRTGETAPIPGSATLTFALAPDPTGDRLYSLGVSPDGRTRLTRHDGAGLQTETVVDSAEGEYPSASLAFDPSSDFLYTSLGREVVKAWTGVSLESLGDPSRGTLSLRALDGLLASLQRDSSVSLWDSVADRSFGELYPFADGSWAAVMADGTILGSDDGRKRVGILVRGHLWESGKSPTAPPSPQRSPAP
jgi:WD40 repeat protein